MKKRIMIPVLVTLMIGGGVLFGAKRVEANTNKPFEGLVSKLAQKFNLDQGQVQTVFDEYLDQKKSERIVTRSQRLEDRLNKLVDNKSISEDQRAKILLEIKSLQDKYSSIDWRNLDRKTRNEKLKELREEWKKWLTDNGINLAKTRTFLPFVGPRF